MPGPVPGPVPGKPSGSAAIGIIVGATVAGVAVFAALIAVGLTFMRRRAANAAEHADDTLEEGGKDAVYLPVHEGTDEDGASPQKKVRRVDQKKPKLKAKYDEYTGKLLDPEDATA